MGVTDTVLSKLTQCKLLLQDKLDILNCLDEEIPDLVTEEVEDDKRMTVNAKVASSPSSLIFQRCTKKEGEPSKTYHMCEIRWNQLPYMTQQRVGWLETRNLSLKVWFFDLNVTISYDSDSRGPSVPSLHIEYWQLTW